MYKGNRQIFLGIHADKKTEEDYLGTLAAQIPVMKQSSAKVCFLKFETFDVLLRSQGWNVFIDAIAATVRN